MSGNTSNKTLRLEDDLWSGLAASMEEQGSTATAWVRNAIRWHLRLPGAELPQRCLVKGRQRKGVVQEAQVDVIVRAVLEELRASGTVSL